MRGKCPVCTERHVQREKDKKQKLLVRLKKIEGQIRGIRKMVEEGV